jgi:hypothetical protein
VWATSLEAIEKLLRTLDTDPTISHLILLYLRSWLSGEAVFYRPPRELEEVIREQNQIGWNRFFEGWLLHL